MSSKFIRAIALVVVSSAATAPARAEEPLVGSQEPASSGSQPSSTSTAFGSAGSGVLMLHHNFVANEVDLLGGSGAELAWFAVDAFSLGLAANVLWGQNTTPGGVTSSSSDTSIFALRVGPRIGANVAMSESVSLWVKAGVDFRYYKESSSASSGFPERSASHTAIAFTASAPILIHPTKNIFLGAGPTLSVDLSSKESVSGSSLGSGSSDQSRDTSKLTAIGLTGLVGVAF